MENKVTSARLREIEKAHHLLKDYDGSTVTAVAEIWAEENLGMRKAEKGTEGYDGTLPNGRRLEVKSTKHGAHSDSGTYIPLSPSQIQYADCVLIVFVDYDSCRVKRTIGPVSKDEIERVGRPSKHETRYHISDILKLPSACDSDVKL